MNVSIKKQKRSGETSESLSNRLLTIHSSKDDKNVLNQKIESLEKSISLSTLLKCINELTEILVKLDEFEIAEGLCKKIIEKCDLANQYKVLKAEAFMIKGIIHLRKKEVSKSEEQFKNALVLFNETNNRNYVALTLNWQGVVSAYQNEIQIAENRFMNALQVCTSSKIKTIIYRNIAVTRFLSEDISSSLNFLMNAERYNNLNRNMNLEAHILYELSVIYNFSAKYCDSLECLKKLLKNSKSGEIDEIYDIAELSQLSFPKENADNKYKVSLVDLSKNFGEDEIKRLLKLQHWKIENLYKTEAKVLNLFECDRIGFKNRQQNSVSHSGDKKIANL